MRNSGLISLYLNTSPSSSSFSALSHSIIIITIIIIIILHQPHLNRPLYIYPYSITNSHRSSPCHTRPKGKRGSELAARTQIFTILPTLALRWIETNKLSAATPDYPPTYLPPTHLNQSKAQVAPALTSQSHQVAQTQARGRSDQQTLLNLLILFLTILLLLTILPHTGALELRHWSQSRDTGTPTKPPKLHRLRIHQPVTLARAEENRPAAQDRVEQALHQAPLPHLLAMVVHKLALLMLDAITRMMSFSPLSRDTLVTKLGLRIGRDCIRMLELRRTLPVFRSVERYGSVTPSFILILSTHLLFCSVSHVLDHLSTHLLTDLLISTSSSLSFPHLPEV
jgi:hypothetical protein